MIDRGIELVAEHLMSGQRITVYDIQRHFKLNKRDAAALLERAQNYVEDRTIERQTRKQADMIAKRKAERHFNQSGGTASRQRRF